MLLARKLSAKLTRRPTLQVRPASTQAGRSRAVNVAFGDRPRGLHTYGNAKGAAGCHGGACFKVSRRRHRFARTRRLRQPRARRGLWRGQAHDLGPRPPKGGLEHRIPRIVMCAYALLRPVRPVRRARRGRLTVRRLFCVDDGDGSPLQWIHGVPKEPYCGCD
jgi:hypothetical protein